MSVSNQDFIKTIDLTGDTSVSAADICQVTDTATTAADKGIQIVTTDTGATPDVPNASATTKWQRNTWKRITSTGVKTYQWDPNASTDGTYLKWKEITPAVPDGSIGTAQLADASVTDAKIVGMAYTKLTGAPSALPPNGSAGGDLAGSTYPNPVVKANAIDSTKLQSDASVNTNRAVTTNHIRDGAVTVDKLGVGAGTALQQTRVNAGQTALEFFTPSPINSLGTPTAPDSLKIVRVNTAGNGYELAVPFMSAKSTANGTNAMPAAGALLTVPHLLGAKPALIRVSIVVSATSGTDAGWVAGDELELESYRGIFAQSLFAVYADATNVYLRRNSDTQINVLHKTTGVYTSVTSTFVVRINSWL